MKESYMNNINRDTIFSKVTKEVIVRIIGYAFVDLRGEVPTPTLTTIRNYVTSALTNSVMTEGTTFSMIVRSLSTESDGSETSVDKAIASNRHIKFQIQEIAKTLSPIIIQSIRALDEFQAEASEILFHLQEQITQKLTQDYTQAPFEIVEVDLGVLDNADDLSTAETIAEQHLPNPDKVYMVHEYRTYCKRIPFHNLTVQEKAQLSKFLMDNDLYSETLRHALSNDVPPNLLFPDNLRSPKTHADYLTTLWDYAIRLKSLLQALPEDYDLDSNVVENIKGFLERVALAIHWAHYVIDFTHKNDLIATHDHNTIYVYPWSYNKLENDKEETIKNFVRSKIITSKKPPVSGYTVKDIVNSKGHVGNLLSDYRRNTFLDQKAHTKRIINTVVREALSDYPNDWVIKIIYDLMENSEETLSDILSALIDRCGDYYLKSLYDSTETQEFSSENPNETRARVILVFLFKVIKERIVTIS